MRRLGDLRPLAWTVLGFLMFAALVYVGSH